MAVIGLAIDQLVLRGVPPADAAAVRAGFEAELLRLLPGAALAEHRSPPPSRLTAAVGATPRQTGAAIAQSLVQALDGKGAR